MTVVKASLKSILFGVCGELSAFGIVAKHCVEVLARVEAGV
eukprot:CAMPEP_0178371866 /NCGR_PEP_ID=MMETSP0689_2-20121128/1048_1 /TAXON_ID=160604 /ORGANISM="Amphidinium massartii, Strain CS-259" /LENGTH=40 /DNA_ID= /DNA_START= /DNA_END= /DNA_ORIENTATION=